MPAPQQAKPSLEHELETEFHETFRGGSTSRVDAGDDAEIVRSISYAAVRIAEIRVIHEVEGFRTELQLDRLPDREGTEYTQVKVDISGSAQGVPPGIAEANVGNCSERAGIEVR